MHPSGETVFIHGKTYFVHNNAPKYIFNRNEYRACYHTMDEDFFKEHFKKRGKIIFGR